uniref:(northern house mosquito) hypothetical protein n=1 Tax=Culex pipiens TaxID=7175 RepID=A0A8D8BW92_CULPI
MTASHSLCGKHCSVTAAENETPLYSRGSVREIFLSLFCVVGLHGVCTRGAMFGLNLRFVCGYSLYTAEFRFACTRAHAVLVFDRVQKTQNAYERGVRGPLITLHI